MKHKNLNNFCINGPISMKLDIQTQNLMPSSKNSKPEVPNVSYVTPAAAILKTDKRRISAILRSNFDEN